MTTILYRAKNDKNGDSRLILTVYAGQIFRRFNLCRFSVTVLPMVPRDVVDVTPQQFNRMVRVSEDVSALYQWLGAKP